MGMSDSKLILRNDLERLFTEEISLQDFDYWENLFSSGISMNEAFQLIHPDDIRILKRAKGLNNLKCFFLSLVSTLKDGINEILSEKICERTMNKIYTSIRILTRVIPFIQETPLDERMHNLFWTPITHENVSFEINEDLSTKIDDSMLSNTIGYNILSCLNHLLFLKNFTVEAPNVHIYPKEEFASDKVDTRLLWKGGIGTRDNLNNSSASSKMIRTRIEVLRCYIMCLSASLFYSIEEYRSNMPLWLSVCTSGNLPYTANLFASLISTCFKYDPVGLGIPFSSFFSNEDEEELVDLSLQLLVILVDFNPSIFVKKDNPEANVANGDGTVHNFYRTMLSEIKNDFEIDMIYTGLCKLLSTLPNSHLTYIPKSFKTINFHQELLIILWHLITTNQVFLQRVTRRLNSNKILLPLLYLLLDSSNSCSNYSLYCRTGKNSRKKSSSNELLCSSSSQDSRNHVSSEKARLDENSFFSHSNSTQPSKVGLLHMCSFIILVLSADREFAVRLNDRFFDKFPLDIPLFHGCHADLCVLVIHKVVIDSVGNPSNDSFIDMLLTVLCNISAYIKSFCLESCLKLLNLFDRFSRPSWIFKARYHYHAIFFLLDVLNNLIQYQYEGNQQLVYSILRQKNLFLDLKNLNLPQRSICISRSSTPEANVRNYSSTHPIEELSKKGGNPINDFSNAENDLNNEEKKRGSFELGNSEEICVEKTSTLECTSQTFSTSCSVSSLSSSSSHSCASSSSESPSSSLLRPSNSWNPTEEWFAEWKTKLPLQAILRLIDCLLPLVEAECTEKGITDQNDVLAFLERTTMVGLLPVPHPIIIRNYQSNSYTSLWLTSYMWGVLFTKLQRYALFDWKFVKLIVISDVS